MSDISSIKSEKSEKSNNSKSKEETLPITFLIKFIKPFDGSRDELSSFISDCNKAFSLASIKQKLVLLDYIQTQISGKAKAACVNRRFLTWDELKDFLKTMYQDVKHYSQLLCDLTNLRQYPSEQVSQFVYRVETCLKKCINSIQQNSTNAITLAGKLEMLQEIAINRFTYFSNPNISSVLRIRDIKTLNEAISIAVSEERVINMYNPRNKSEYSQNRKINYHESNSKSDYKNTPSCSNSNYNRDIPVNPKPNASDLKTNFRGNSPQTTRYQNALQCRYCKENGHSIEKCIKREYNNSRKNNSNYIQKNSNPLPAEFGTSGRK